MSRSYAFGAFFAFRKGYIGLRSVAGPGNGSGFASSFPGQTDSMISLKIPRTVRERMSIFTFLLYLNRYLGGSGI